MRTTENWEARVFPKALKAHFPPRIRGVLENADGWDKIPSIKEAESIFLWGPKGSGKTIQACQIMLARIKQNYMSSIHQEYCFVVVPDLFRQIKSTFDGKHPMGLSEHEVTEYFCTVDFLILDDLGTLKPTEWVYQGLFHIINHRYNHLRPTIFTSNIDLDELAELFGDDRITSRIERMAVISKKKKYDG